MHTMDIMDTHDTCVAVNQVHVMNYYLTIVDSPIFGYTEKG